MSWFPIPRNIPHAVVISSDKLKALQAEAAAAPELLTELQNIANANTRDWDDPSDFKAWAQSRARAAIARATGGEV